MDFYAIQVHRINLAKYPKDHLTRQLLQAKRFMDQHFAENICLERVAQQAFLSKFHFIRLFKSYYGNTPFQYLTAVRIQAAKKLLKTNKPVLEVCMATGFESVPTFTTLFKRSTGSTPARFQRKAQKSNIR
jgi:transcriptional regulator GlxA family with amidase domain